MENNEKTKNNIVHDSYDANAFIKSVMETELSQNINAHQRDFGTYTELTEDTFNSLFKYAPKFEDQAKVDEQYNINRQLSEKVMQSQSYPQLRTYTKLDEGTSAMAACTLTENILKENKDLVEQLKKEQKKAQENRMKLKKLKEEYDKHQNNNSPQAQQAKQQLQQQMQQAMTQLKQAQQNSQQIGSQIGVTQAIQKAVDSTKATEEMFAMGRGTGAGSDQKVPVDQKIKFSKAFSNNEKFRKLLNQIGRMKRLADRKQKQKTKRTITELDNIKQNSDISHLVSSELLYLADPELEVLFMKKLMEHELLCYEFIGIEPKGKGPIISCLDVSGSMGGEPDEISKAIAVALVMIAHQQKRDSYIILFDCGVRRVFDFPKEDSNYWDQVLKMAEYFSGGGTCFDEPLRKAMSLFTESDEKKRWTKGDIVFISDGDGNLSEGVKNEFKKLKSEKKINCYTIIIGYSYNFVDHQLKEVSDTLTAVSELDDTTAGNLFESM